MSCGTNSMTCGVLTCSSLTSSGTMSCGTNSMTAGVITSSSITSSGTVTCTDLVTTTQSGVLLVNNSVINANNSSGAAEIAFIPRATTNSTTIQYGTGGFNLLPLQFLLIIQHLMYKYKWAIY